MAPNDQRLQGSHWLTEDPFKPSGLGLPLDEEQVDRDAGKQQSQVNSDQLRGLKDGQHHQEQADDQESDGKNEIYLKQV